MLVYILKKDKLRKLNLPEKVFGEYSIYDEDESVLANIVAVDGKWILKKNNNIEISNADGQKNDEGLELIEYNFYTITKINTNAQVSIITTPLYDTNSKQYTVKTNTITIGSGETDTIQYMAQNIIPTHITLNKKNNYWVATTTKDDAYVNDHTFKSKNLFHGSYLFLYGLKIIVVNNTFIINNPNNKVRISSEFFEQKNDTEKQLIFQKKIADDTPLYTNEEYFFKAPRFKGVIETEKVKIDTPPEKQKDTTDPMILQIGPRLTMSITAFYTLFNTLNSYVVGETTFQRCIPSILAIVTMLLSSFMWPSITRAAHKRKMLLEENKRQRKYKKYLEQKRQKIVDIKNYQKQILVENNIPLEECQSIIYNRKRNLWERSIDNSDFLSIKLGIGRVESQIEIDDPSDKFSIEDADNLQESLDKVLEEAKYIDDCPMNLSLSEKKVVAVVGNNVLTKYFMDSVLLQIMTFHSYTDLKIVTLTNKKNEYLWEYMKILPHSWNNVKTSRYFATNSDEMNEINNEMDKIFTERKDNDENVKIEDNGEEKSFERPRYMDYYPYYFIFVDDLETARNIPFIKKILSYKTNLGFTIVIRNDRLSNLPSECSTFIYVDEQNSGLFENELTANNQKQFVPEMNRSVDMYGCAQVLANIPITKEKAKYELPTSVSFLSMYKVSKVEQLNSLERWKTNNPVVSLSVPIGVNQDGELFKMDAHEKAYGPHGLVAGMTGSGKSEWLISYILSLAVNFHPDEVQFVIIDYKGGGLALSFENKELGIKLPHLAGTITNLDKSSITRALTSIEAELKRRQNLFNEAREKLHESSINIYKYQQYYRKGLLKEPMSHLFIISDEFAELRAQEPEFLDQLVSTARIGRSLGVHLILATQKPSGVVNDQIWSNARFKVCLRVQDKSDSQEMIKCPDAAMLKTTGSFYLQVGYNELFALGQSAWAGAKYYPSDIVKTNIDQSIQYIDNMGKTINNFDEEIFEESKPIENKGEELLNIVSYLSNISEQVPVVSRQLWLTPIPTTIMLEDVKKRYNHKITPFDINVVVGEYDNPALQKQNIFEINLRENTLIYGEGGSGKENLISTIIWSSIIEHTPTELNYYIIDFGAETLRMFAKFPHVGEVAFSDNIDVVAGILDMVADEIEKRKDLFADYNGNYESYLKESKKQLARWVIVINAWDVFQDSLAKITDVVLSMFRDGPKYGISFIISTTAHQSIRSKTGGLFKNKLVLHQPDDTNYRTILGCQKNLIPANAFSRGVCQIADGTFCEFQTAFITNRENINTLVRKNAENFAAYYKTSAKSLPKIPDNVTSTELAKYITNLNNVPIGYNFHEKDIAKFDLLKEKIFPICVDDFKSTMKSIYGIINILSKVPGCKVRVFDFDNLYKGTNLDILYYNDKFDATVIALENDLMKRSESQDQGVTIILGAGLMKQKLVDEGKEHLNNYLNIIHNAKKSTIILIDTYERMKRLKIEPWYAKINTSYGIWLGDNIVNQNLFSVKPITMDERKLNFEGIGYLIEDSNYHLIKTVLDGED